MSPPTRRYTRKTCRSRSSPREPPGIRKSGLHHGRRGRTLPSGWQSFGDVR
jgi:hypothetical protein